MKGQCNFKPTSNEQVWRKIYAEVVTRVTGSLNSRGLPGYHKSLFVELNVSNLALYWTKNIEDTRS